MSKDMWIELISASLQTQEEEIDCETCFDLLDQYVDLLTTGTKPAQLLPEIEHHMQVCHCCHTEMQALLKAIEVANNDPSLLS